jgi:hypothetical protein
MRTPDLAFQRVGVAGFEPTASSSRTVGRAGNGSYLRRLLAGGGRCGSVLVGLVAVLRSCTTELVASGRDEPCTGESD